jgi:MinD-like ATPase involved in chromosome partitioning or flagellar assembly
MAAERYVVLGLAHVGSPWFRNLARWATAAVLPLEFVKTVSVEEVRARLRSGRAFSALLVDDGVPGTDRDLVDEARQQGCAVIVVGDRSTPRPWRDLGVSAVLPTGFDPGDLLDALQQVSTPVGRIAPITLPTAGPQVAPSAWRGRLVAVTGAGGTGRSTIAIALAQGLAADPRFSDVVCLADLALDAEQGVLHDTPDVVPSVLELAEAHRSGVPTVEQVRAATWTISERSYALLLGLRRHRDWTALRPRSFETALESLRRAFRVVVADVDADVEGEAVCGSTDVEDRNLMARTTTAEADVVVVVGHPGMKGLHSALRVVRGLLEHGVEPERILPLLNRAPRGPRARAELTSAFGALIRPTSQQVGSPVFVGDRRRVDELLRDGSRLPDSMCAAVTRPVTGLLDHLDRPDRADRADEAPVAVAPGSLGSWTEDTEP